MEERTLKPLYTQYMDCKRQRLLCPKVCSGFHPRGVPCPPVGSWGFIPWSIVYLTQLSLNAWAVTRQKGVIPQSNNKISRKRFMLQGVIDVH
ncbi:hypothetical protein LY76DRAFT_594018 [Colletotrichum caudatum]|nr:hypothetical protein LY76DRAFT_594018 [Colletotrichum caudatum]